MECVFTQSSFTLPIEKKKSIESLVKRSKQTPRA